MSLDAAGQRPAPRFWVSAERLSVACLAQPGSVLQLPIQQVGHTKDMPTDREAAVQFVLRGWLESSGPVTVLLLLSIPSIM